jgi:hypothetical protein
MSWENNIFNAANTRIEKKKDVDAMVALALTSKKWDKADPYGGTGFADLPAELRTKIFEYFERKLPLNHRGRRPPGTVYREPKDFLLRRRIKDEIEQEIGKRRMRELEGIYEKTRIEIQERFAQEEARRAQIAQARKNVERAQEHLRLVLEKRYPQTRKKSPHREFSNMREQSRKRRGLAHNMNLKYTNILRKKIEARANKTISKKQRTKVRNFTRHLKHN